MTLEDFKAMLKNNPRAVLSLLAMTGLTVVTVGDLTDPKKFEQTAQSLANFFSMSNLPDSVRVAALGATAVAASNKFFELSQNVYAFLQEKCCAKPGGEAAPLLVGGTTGNIQEQQQQQPSRS